MVAKDDVEVAQGAIEDALRELVCHSPSDVVSVFESQWGHLRAIVGSDIFQSKGLGERQEMVWDFLRGKVDPSHLVHLYGVHVMDIAEYKRNVRSA